MTACAHCSPVFWIRPCAHVWSAEVGLDPGEPARQPAATPE